MKQIYSGFSLGELTVSYILDTETRIMGLQLLPNNFENTILEHRNDLQALPENHFFEGWDDYPAAWNVEPLVLLSCSGYPRAGGFSQGRTMRNGKCAEGLYFQNQRVSTDGNTTLIRTVMGSAEKIKVIHYLEHSEGSDYLTSYAEAVNEGNQNIRIELFSSFTMGFISSLHKDNAPGQYRIHRFRSSWSSEGRHVSNTAEELELEDSWCHHAVKCERFGNLGSMPVSKWFPFVGIEDVENGIIWGGGIEAPGSWQMEVYRKDDFFHLSGGQADREFGHWTKVLSPGSSFHSGKAWISAVSGGIDEISKILTDPQKQELTAEPDMSPVFNEWCTSWGEPSAEKLIPLLDKVSSLGLRYFVIDAGWYADSSGNWETTQGDWNVSPKLFPEGLKSFCNRIREHGLIPGLWFELEVVGEDAQLSKKTDWLLHLDGKPIKAGSRYFLDFRLKEVRDYLEEKLAGLIRECGIGYIKIDYNENIGLGCDGEDSPGEELRKHLMEVQRFYRRIKSLFPELVMENCSSGGHRLEPSFINLLDVSSFSDAHETVSIPVIAANLHRLLIPSKSLIWAVLHPRDTVKRLHYSLSSLFLGRLCISGEVDELPEESLATLKDAIALHRLVEPVLLRGESFRFGRDVVSYNAPQGWQLVLRYSEDRRKVLMVLHTFAGSSKRISVDFADSEDYYLKDSLAEKSMIFLQKKDSVIFGNLSDFTGAVFYLEKKYYY